MKCPVCHSNFSRRESLCKDWIDAEQAFGCPHCQFYLVKERNNDRADQIAMPLLATGIMLPASMLLGYFASHPSEKVLLLYALMILASACGIILLRYSKFLSRWTKV